MSRTMKKLCKVCKTVVFLKRLTGDIHEEVESHNRLLDRMGNDMDASRGIMSGTMAWFKMVFEKKSSQRMCVSGLFCGFLPNHILSIQGSQIVYAGLKRLAAPGLKFVIMSQNDWPY